MLRSAAQSREESGPAQQPALIENMDDYIELLYDDDNKIKVKGTERMMQLARSPESLEFLAQHETMLGAVSRTLQEDGKKNVDLALNIVYIYWAFSNYSQFHPLLAQHQAGATTLRFVDFEIKRFEARQKDFATKTAGMEGDVLAKAHRKFAIAMHQQEKLLYVCVHTLLNLAEDLTVERKMRKRNILGMLLRLLGRKNPDLILLVVVFLKKLSIFVENVEEMVADEAVAKLAPLLGSEDEVLLNNVLRLLLNLSFNGEMRQQMVEIGLVPRLVDLLKEPSQRLAVLRLLYHLSCDEGAKSVFSYTECIPMVMQLLLEIQDETHYRELLALAINLSSNVRNAEMMCEHDGLQAMIERVFRTHDPLMMKVIRNISFHETSIKANFADYVVDFVQLAKQCTETELLIEVVGVLGNLTMADSEYSINFAKLIQDFDMLSWLHGQLAPGRQLDDGVVLECIVFVGTILHDEDSAPTLASSPICRDLFYIFQEKLDDDEMVLQLTYVFYQMMHYPETRDVLLAQTQTMYNLIDLIQDGNAEVRRMADLALDIIAEYDDSCARMIRQKKFEQHNAEWLETVDEEDMLMQHATGQHLDSSSMLDDSSHLYERERVVDFDQWNNVEEWGEDDFR